MSKPITVVKAKQKNRPPLLRLFIRLVTYFTWSEVSLSANHKARKQSVGPASEAGG